MTASKIEWTDVTWNPVRGCSRVSEGCRNCYAERQAARFSRTDSVPSDYGGHEAQGRIAPFEGFVQRTPSGPRWTGRVELIESKLREPLSWRKPRRVFVNSMSDLFHEALPGSAVARVFDVMREAKQHTFQVLTKRPKEMRERVPIQALPNVWLGVSVEDQDTADARIPVLLATPAAVRFVSYEPALGPVSFEPAWLSTDLPCPGCDEAECDHRSIDWLIVGGESGPGARPCDVAWIRSAVEQCKAAGVPCFTKQLGAHVTDRNDRFSDDPAVDLDHWPIDQEIDWRNQSEKWQGAAVRVLLRDSKGGDPSEWPEDLRVREFPA